VNDIRKDMANPRICVVGAGRWGMNHIRTLVRLGFLAGIVESDDGKRNDLKEQFPSVPNFSSIRDAIDEDFDGFIVATPAETHYEIAKFIIEHRKHVLVEKPITLKADESRDLKSMAEEKGVNLMVGHLLLFHPAIRKMKELIKAGKIGKLQYMYSNRLNLGTVRTEENILWSFAPHDISIFQYFTESFPEEIMSRGGAFLQPGIHDSSMTILTYPGNRVGHIFVSWLHPFREHRIVVIGSKGMFSFEDSSSEKHILFYEKGIDWIQGEPITRDGPTDVIPCESTLPLDEELKYFAAHLDGRPVEIADARNAVEVLEILEKATESLMEGKGQMSDIRSQMSEDEKTDVRYQKSDVGGRKVRGQNSAVGGQGFFAHHSAEIGEGCTIGSGTKIWHFSHVLSDTKIGENCNIGQNVVVGPGVTIGNGCKIQNNVSIYKGVHLEDDVFCGPSMVFTNVYNPRAAIRKMDELRPTLVKKGATIGANATILCGITIGRYAFIGAGAVLTKDTPDYALMAGNPASRIGWVCECGERPGDDLRCEGCGKDYEELDGVVREKMIER